VPWELPGAVTDSGTIVEALPRPFLGLPQLQAIPKEKK
jgi:hypothetical protein